MARGCSCCRYSQFRTALSWPHIAPIASGPAHIIGAAWGIQPVWKLYHSSENARTETEPEQCGCRSARPAPRGCNGWLLECLPQCLGDCLVHGICIETCMGRYVRNSASLAYRLWSATNGNSSPGVRLARYTSSPFAPSTKKSRCAADQPVHT